MIQEAMFKSRIGMEALKLIYQLTLPEILSLANIVENMDEALICETNETYEWFCFNMRSKG